METIKVYKDNPVMSKTQSQYLRLYDVVKNNGAIGNDFFEKCTANNLTREQLIKYLFNWYPITESFAVHGLLYTHHVAKYLQKNIEATDFENVENFFCDVLEISKGEFEIINIAPNNFHPKAFTRLAPKLGISVKDLLTRNFKLNPETKILEKNITANFSNGDDILCGFANFFVVETIAIHIVKSMDNTFGNLKNQDGQKLYDDYEMVYITEHLKLEVLHGDEVATMLDKLNLSEERFSTLATYVGELSLNFSTFWKALLTK